MGKFISLFAGVGGFDLGMEQAGHECVAQVEWDKNAAGVLKHRWPSVPLFCDVSKVSADDLPDADFITYGFPCQDLSVAGKREGLDGKRSGLFYEATRLIRELRSRGCGLRFAVAENVGGLFSADDGLALARCIRELLDCGACETGWRLLDSQYFGVAQRRKRVFIISDFGGESVDEILAITESLPGHPAPSREAGKGTAGDATESVGEGEQDIVGTLCNADHKGAGNQYVNDNKLIIEGVDWYNNAITGDVNHTLKIGGDVPGVIEQKAIPIHDMATRHAGKRGKKSDGKGNGLGVGQEGDPSPTLTKGDHHAVVSWNGDTTPKASEDVSVTLRSQQGGEGVGVAHSTEGPCYENHPGDSRVTDAGETCPTITKRCGTGGGNLPYIRQQENLTVRRLTPIECERLQGFPDNWTAEKMELTIEGNEWKATGKVLKQADGPRYKAMGNAVTVNVAEWIGKQIGKVLDK
jgi:DNA (cytosine-5)-methyltransferase 1